MPNDAYSYNRTFLLMMGGLYGANLKASTVLKKVKWGPCPE
jgi:hypothetical protein